MNKIFYFLFSASFSFAFGMEKPTTIHKDLQRKILETPNLDFYRAAELFNAHIKAGTIAPILANTQWFIHTLENRMDIFSLVPKVQSDLAREWLAEYLQHPSQFEIVRAKLEDAILRQDTQLVDFLLSTKSAELACSSCKVVFSFRFTYFSLLCKEPIKIFKTLLESGGDITYLEPKEGLAPIHVAAWNGEHEALELLLNHGQSPDFCCKQGETPLIHLCKQTNLKTEHLKCAFLLLEQNANSRIPSKKGKKPVELADPNNVGGIRGQLKALIQSYEHTQKLA